ncbi:MAG: LptF/LptG family permease [Planctomycetes bacterium]|nr:LptF/LptG family permease [Planctomycetota bacterium]
MPILQRYLLKELTVNAAITFAVVILIFIVGGSIQFLHKAEFFTLVNFGISVWFFITTHLDEMLPMTVLVAVVLTYGRVSAENEINAMRASGVHLHVALTPALLFGLVGSYLVLHVADRVAPAMEFQEDELLEAGLDSVVKSLMDRGGNSFKISKTTQIMWGGVDELDRLLNVRIKVYPKGEGPHPPEQEYLADRARLDPDHKRGLLRFHMEGVRALQGSGKDGFFQEMTYSIPLREEAKEKKLKHHTLAELVAAEGRKFDGAFKQRAVRSEFHRRVAGALACVLFVLVGVPLAIIFRHGNRMVAFVIAILIALVVYYPTFMLGEVLAKETDLHPILAIWSGSIVLLALGVGLTSVVVRR